jgi:hypothetical protein
MHVLAEYEFLRRRYARVRQEAEMAHLAKMTRAIARRSRVWRRIYVGSSHGTRGTSASASASRARTGERNTIVMRHLAQNRVAVSRILALGVLLVAALVVVSPWLASKPALAPATFTVTNTSDSGAGSLRQAMLDANSIPGVDSIDFDIPGSGVQVISPDSELPNITEGVSINGYTQSGPLPTPGLSETTRCSK